MKPLKVSVAILCIPFPIHSIYAIEDDSTGGTSPDEDGEEDVVKDTVSYFTVKVDRHHLCGEYLLKFGLDLKRGK